MEKIGEGGGMSDVEQLQAFNAIRGYLSAGDQQDLAHKLNLDMAKLDNRLGGLKNEDEFCLIMYFLDTCKHMIRFDEGVSVLTGSYQPDMLIKLNNNVQFFVEIKSVAEDTFKISGGNLKKRIDFADELGYPLYFAVRLRGYWTLFPSQYLRSKSGKLVFSDDIEQSEFNDKFGSQYYMFRKGVKIESVYSRIKGPIGGIQNIDHGNLISYKLMFKGKVILQANEGDESKIGYSLILENLQDVMSIQSQIITAVDSDKTLVTEELVEDVVSCDYFFFMSPIKHTVHDLGFMYDTTTFFKNFLAERKQMLTKNMVEAVLSELKAKGMPIDITKSLRLQKPKTA
jgi:Holliday junction resolvase